MKPEVMQIANEMGLWLISFSIIAVVLCQALLYTKLSFKVAKDIEYPSKKCWEAFKVGLITSIGPSIAVFIVMVGMMAVVGTPITWLRLSIIGSASTELTASTIGAQAAGVQQLGSAEYTVQTLSVSFWTMAINGFGWLILTALFTHKLEDIRQKLGGGDARWIAILSMAAAIGCFGYLNANTVIAGIRNIEKGIPRGIGPIYAMLGGLLSMVAFTKISQKQVWLKEYTLGLAMLVGMIVAIVLA